MDDFNGFSEQEEFAAWLEEGVAALFSSGQKIRSACIVAILDDESSITAYFQADAQDMAVFAHKINSDIIMEIITKTLVTSKKLWKERAKMSFETLTLIHKLLSDYKNEASLRLKELGKEFAEFRKSHPWADENDFIKAEEMAVAKDVLDHASRALKEFNTVKWQGTC